MSPFSPGIGLHASAQEETSRASDRRTSLISIRLPSQERQAAGPTVFRAPSLCGNERQDNGPSGPSCVQLRERFAAQNEPQFRNNTSSAPPARNGPRGIAFLRAEVPCETSRTTPKAPAASNPKK